ncbi:MAG: tetratricopeptide repeat protein [Thermodesulfobacteriota bacterium]|nr:MAG: tetratricopeptide repeat protein [Thermodesulfobacteriota bacterium]
MVLAWNKNYGESIEIYREVLGEEPGFREARLGLARTLGWAGRYDEAIEEYKSLLAARPGDSEAGVGMARVLAWKRDYDASKDAYMSVLKKDPGNKEALLGLATTLWWKGDLGSALGKAGEVIALDPENAGARALEKRIRRSRGPLLSFYYTDSSDSDGNDLRIYKTHAFFAAGRGLRFDLDYSVFKADRLEDEARANILTGGLSYRLNKLTTFRTRLAFVNTDASSDSTSHMAGGISLRRVINKKLRGGLSYSHSPLLDTAQLIRNNIRVDDFSASLYYDAGFASFAGVASYGSYSDGNSRNGFSLDIRRASRYFGKNPVLFGGYRLNYRAFEKDLNTGYFDPGNFISNTLYLEVKGNAYNGRLEYRAEAEAGLQNYNAKSEYLSRFYLQAIAHLTDNINVDLSYKFSRSAIESTSGFRYEEYKLGINYLF